MAAQAKRLLADPRARPAVGDFFVQMLGLEQLETVSKDPAVFRTWKDALRQPMRDEVSAFGQQVVFEGGAASALWAASHSFLSAALAPLYRVSGVTSQTPVRTALNPIERSGLLTSAAFLATFAKPHTTDPIARGKEVRERVLCQHLPEPPATVMAVEPPPSPNLTARQRYEMHRKDPSCAACHNLIDPLGLGFENYDGIGQYRTSEGRLAIDARGEILGADDVLGAFTGAVELSRKLATSSQVRDCVATQYARYALGRNESAGDACGLGRVRASLAGPDGSLLALVESVVTSELARVRTK
jgi:hypothetical protein